MINRFTLSLGILWISTILVAQNADDPWLFLEDVNGVNALAWVAGQNQRTAEILTSKPEFTELYQQALEILNSESRIPEVSQRGRWLYNLWNDTAHPRGLYRRTMLNEFRKADPKWETVLDIDALSKKEGKPWVFQEMRCLPEAYTKCLVFLAQGGTDAAEVREFDMHTLSFVANGFFLPAAKSEVSWMDADHIFVNTDFGSGSLTESGFGRIAKLWSRGTKLQEAQTVLEVNPKSIRATAYRIRTRKGNIDLAVETVSTWESVYYQILNGKLLRLILPPTATIEGGYAGQLVITLDEDWVIGGRTFTAGSVVVASPETLRGGKAKIELLAAPTATEIVVRVNPTEQGILVTTLRNVQGRLCRSQQNGSAWTRSVISLPEMGTISVTDVNDQNGDFFVRYESFITPPTLYFVSSNSLKPEKLKVQTATFDGSQFEVRQFWTSSEDGTKIPYFAVMKKGTPLNGRNPTHMFSYGGFRIPLMPSYSGTYEELSGAYGKLWLQRGGVFVLANIRGGGEFGPAWHKSALLQNRVKAYQDFEAVARDLFARRITSPQHLGIEGRSNGGLLVTAVMTRHPELFGAIICGSPLIDLKRYNKLLEGAFWTAELGNPDDPHDWEFMKTFSPYQNVKRGQNYPPVFFYASSTDDRVHPGHARKMVAKMLELGYTDTLYYENTEGGHHASSTNKQLAYRLALAYTHLWEHLNRP